METIICVGIGALVLGFILGSIGSSEKYPEFKINPVMTDTVNTFKEEVRERRLETIERGIDALLKNQISYRVHDYCYKCRSEVWDRTQERQIEKIKSITQNINLESSDILKKLSQI
jgi:hypothetical protein